MANNQVAAVTIKKGKNPKHVILVGGFGRSRYVLTTLKKRFENEVEVLQSRGTNP
ncbi:hypothetical protein QBC36DRAFT_291001 [Triangularia setosa]|uniref:Uncharacterized protein n=1 Tax=Triangularia setosa TaxID=2587417 RepID=A0AAN6W6J2_9PEZI|nr:hypothetical protein QBC36DRAFT_291001 [Podospora setosa]